MKVHCRSPQSLGPLVECLHPPDWEDRSIELVKRIYEQEGDKRGEKQNNPKIRERLEVERKTIVNFIQEELKGIRERGGGSNLSKKSLARRGSYLKHDSKYRSLPQKHLGGQ